MEQLSWTPTDIPKRDNQVGSVNWMNNKSVAFLFPRKFLYVAPYTLWEKFYSRQSKQPNTHPWILHENKNYCLMQVKLNEELKDILHLSLRIFHYEWILNTNTPDCHWKIENEIHSSNPQFSKFTLSELSNLIGRHPDHQLKSRHWSRFQWSSRFS